MAKTLSPTEIAREFNMGRREVIELCMDLGVPIFHGRIEKHLFAQALVASRRDDVATWVLMDATGNLVDSFDDATSAWSAYRRIRDADPANAEHVALIGYDADGEPIAGGKPSKRAHGAGSAIAR
jgi:hypothetical protein